MLYLALVRCELAYAAILWNSITSIDDERLEHVQRKLVALCHNRFFTHDQVTYEDFLKFTKPPYPAGQRTLSWCIICFRLLRLKMFFVSFGYYRYLSSPQFQKFLSVCC